MNILSNESLSFPVIVVIVSVGFLIIFTNSFLQNTLAFEENLVILQTGIILTAEDEYAISNNFQTRIVQDGKIIRISGVTTTGEIFYAYQKTTENYLIWHTRLQQLKLFLFEELPNFLQTLKYFVKTN